MVSRKIFPGVLVKYFLKSSSMQYSVLESHYVRLQRNLKNTMRKENTKFESKSNDSAIIFFIIQCIIYINVLSSTYIYNILILFCLIFIMAQYTSILGIFHFFLKGRRFLSSNTRRDRINTYCIIRITLQNFVDEL